jgi:ribosomal protein S18 acetylase RimI-like enzyme
METLSGIPSLELTPYSALPRVEFAIRLIESTEFEIVRQLLAGHGWGHRVTEKLAFEQLILDSTYAYVAVANEEIIGFVRAISDRQSNGYISMLLVLPACRRLGVGRALVQELIRQHSGITWVLRAGRENAKEFFASLGFVASTEAMELRRL